MKRYKITITRFSSSDQNRKIEPIMKKFPAVLDEESQQRGLVWLVESNESFDAVHARLVRALRGEFHFALTCSHGEDQPLAAVV